MKRSHVGLREIADLHTLAAAFHAAARGKRGRGDVEAFRANLDRELARMQAELLDGTITPGPMRCFRIHDPKPRLIHAPAFRDRVLHHAIMAHVGPVLDRSLVADTYACRVGKGTLAAVQRAAAHAARFECFAQIDVRAYFASIDHGILLHLLGRKLANPAILALLARIIAAHNTDHDPDSARGLPIGTLTSQHFANFYLAGLDRCIVERPEVRGFVRYMDDVVWWADDRAGADAVLGAAQAFLADTLKLAAKPPRLARSADGLAFCGFRIMPGRLLLSRRRRHRYVALRRRAERDFAAGHLDQPGLQAGYASALAVTLHANAASWRREELRRRPLEAVLADV